MTNAAHSDRLAWPASHGNTIATCGDCPVCGRQNVELARKERYGTRDSWLVCANEFACFAAWEASRGR